VDIDEQPRSVLLIGVSDAGKTNFLSRLWLALDSGGGLLTKTDLPSDLDYLKTGADHLLRGEFAPHTPHDVRDATEIPVKNTSNGQEFLGTLVVPDLPGEQVLSVFRTRQWSNEWESRISVGCGCLLFVRVDSKELIAPLDWLNCPLQFGSTPAAASADKDSTDKAKPPTQVVLVDWLQFLRKAFTDHVNGSYRPRIGIVVAAWDRVPNDQKGTGPKEWVASNLPLLAQYIDANDDAFHVVYFGVSVTSGDLDADPEFKESYLKGNPRNAGQVVYSLVGAVQSSTDMTFPVAWALGLVDVVVSGSNDSSD
jgi:hypothetical protein